jgi:hypothetical protein
LRIVLVNVVPDITVAFTAFGTAPPVTLFGLPTNALPSIRRLATIDPGPSFRAHIVGRFDAFLHVAPYLDIALFKQAAEFMLSN